MLSVKVANSILKTSNILRIGENSSFKKTLKKIFKHKNLDFILVEKSSPKLMTAVITAKIVGKKFIWIQMFENPPIPGFYTRLLLNQSDTIMVSSKKMAAKLHNFGIDKPKIKLLSPHHLKQPKA